MEVRQLSTWPSQRSLYARAVLRAVPGLRAMPGLRALSGWGRPRPRGAPELEIRLVDVIVDRGRLASYNRVCGFRLADPLPATYPQVMAFPLVLTLMTDPTFPFGVPGLVHIGNRIVQHRPIVAGERLDFAVRAGEVRPHRSGRVVEVVAEVRTAGAVVWVGAASYLSRADSGGGSPVAAAEPTATGDTPSRERGLESVAQWRVPADIGKRYAAVSGDYNPIHISRLGARVFGFRRPIAHGMWTAARALAALEGRLPPSYTFDVEFRRPLQVPARVIFAAAGMAAAGFGAANRGGSRASGGTAGSIRIEVRGARSGKPHLLGEISPQ